jgi:hypothetical protein
LEKIVLNEEGKNHYMWPYDFVKNHYMWPYDFITNLKVFFYYMTFYHKNTCTLWISIISDNYFKFNLKAESKKVIWSHVMVLNKVIWSHVMVLTFFI